MIKTPQSRLKLTLIAAYLLVVLIWSTTPLTIKWSSEGVSYLLGISLRMAIGTLVALVLVMIKYRRLPMHRQARRVYAAVALALFGGMMPVYWGAQYISSGLISVIFGITPMVTGYFAWRFLHEQSFSPLKIIGSLVAVSGLAFIFLKKALVSGDYAYGIAAVLLAVVIHSLSAVWVKSIKVSLPALSIVAGGLLFSMPMFFLVYLLFAPPLVMPVPARALYSIIYLGVMGSVLGFVCYYFLLKHLPASSVALITLITPVLALWIGLVFNTEILSLSIYTGTVLVLGGLAIHQWGDTLFRKLWGS